MTMVGIVIAVVVQVDDSVTAGAIGAATIAMGTIAVDETMLTPLLALVVIGQSVVMPSFI